MEVYSRAALGYCCHFSLDRRSEGQAERSLAMQLENNPGISAQRGFSEFLGIYIAWAGKFMDQWCTQVMRSKLGPMKKVAQTIRAHKQLILNWFEAKDVISLGAVEGQNNKAKVVIRKFYGFKTADMLKITLYHKLGKLPIPKLAHE
jgi:hypothetical protein